MCCFNFIAYSIKVLHQVVPSGGGVIEFFDILSYFIRKQTPKIKEVKYPATDTQKAINDKE